MRRMSHSSGTAWVERDPARGEVRGVPFGYAPGDERICRRIGIVRKAAAAVVSTIVPT